MKKILVPTDFSENSKKALRLAAEIAVANKSSLEILHVNTAAVYAPAMPEMYTAQLAELEQYEASAADDLKNLKREVLQNAAFETLPIETRIESGVLHSSLRTRAQEDGCDLVVMGTQGATSAEEFFIGSNTERVIRTAACPVLAIPVGTESFHPKTVVFPTTLRADQKAAFHTLADWQKSYGFAVKVLYLNNPSNFDTNGDIEAAMRSFANEAGLKDVELFTSSNTFNEEHAILEFAKEAGANLIVMGTHQRRGISHMLFGSLVEDTVNHSNIPVLAVPLK